MSTVADSITDSLSRIGVIAPGETPKAAQMDKGFSVLNICNDTWAAQRLLPPYIARTLATLTASQTSFTVGTGGNINIVRPVYLQKIGFQDTSQSPTLEYPLVNLTDDEYEAIAIKGLTSTLPTAAYYNPTYASWFGTLIPWPIPTQASLQWVVYSPVAIPQFSATSSTLLLPPGYEEFIVTQLAFKLCSIFGVPQDVRQETKLEAEAVEKIVKAANFRITELASPSAGLFNGGRRRGNLIGFLSGP